VDSASAAAGASTPDSLFRKRLKCGAMPTGRFERAIGERGAPGSCRCLVTASLDDERTRPVRFLTA
jgi:hypothetical protein